MTDRCASGSLPPASTTILRGCSRTADRCSAGAGPTPQRLAQVRSRAGPRVRHAPRARSHQQRVASGFRLRSLRSGARRRREGALSKPRRSRRELQPTALRAAAWRAAVERRIEAALGRGCGGWPGDRAKLRVVPILDLLPRSRPRDAPDQQLGRDQHDRVRQASTGSHTRPRPALPSLAKPPRRRGQARGLGCPRPAGRGLSSS